MNLAVVRSADRHREFVADLAAQSFGLGKAQMVSVGRLSPADQARLRCHELPVTLISKPARLRDNSVAFEAVRIGCEWDRRFILEWAVGDRLRLQVRGRKGSFRRRALQSRCFAAKANSTSCASAVVREFLAGSAAKAQVSKSAPAPSHASSARS